MVPIFLSLKLAVITTLLLILLGLPLIYLLHFHVFRMRPFFKTVISLPLVLPPTVLGFYLLVALRPEGLIGQFLEKWLHFRIAFSFAGLVLGSVIFSLPFMVNPVISALEALPASYTEAAFTLGKSRWVTFWRVLLPNTRTSVVTGIMMAFAHTMGEFGLVLMIGGSVPGETKVASIALFEEMTALHYAEANQYALILLGISAAVLTGVYFFSGNKRTTLF
ncbi:MAG: molybdate ABC transporter permease subunit [Bacteroidia bacterium]|nr:molybdate ABC transporter permease subunit [Bacteroidia bacterium]